SFNPVINFNFSQFLFNQTLNLRYNQLTEIPVEIGQLQNLQVLDLGDNQLTEIPAEIGQLQNLQVLSLRDNQLTEIPIEIGQLQNLLVLYLMQNPLTNPPLDIAEQGLEAIRNYFIKLKEQEHKSDINKTDVNLIYITLINDWHVNEFYTFLSIINKIYNLAYAIDDILHKEIQILYFSEIITQSIISDSWSIPEKDQLKIISIELHSPGEANLGGAANAVKTFRDTFIDSDIYRRMKELEIEIKEIEIKMEKQKLEQGTIETEMMRLELEQKKYGIFKQIEALREKEKLEEINIKQLKDYFKKLLDEAVNNYKDKCNLRYRQKHLP
ncbi:MAG: leucine-rich repeat domain-containing protein, partial [Spirochaetales bacterium]|nr:leucine-rich repeat domain-containing protein [Spirochaetales bacterium]